MILIATNKFHVKLYEKLRIAFGGNAEDRGLKSMSLDLDDDQDFKIFDKDERILLYHGEWDDIVKLKELSLCCQYLVNWTFWNFHGNKGDKLNKLIHSKCDNLKQTASNIHITAKKKCVVYATPINADNGGELYNLQNVRYLLQIRPPSLNNNLQDYVSNSESAYRELSLCYDRILKKFYKLTDLEKPINDVFIQKDIANWNNKPLIKKELDLSLSVDVDGNSSRSKSDSHNSALIDVGNDIDSLHFSLKKLPEYKFPNLAQYPKFNGHWKNALSVYIQEKSKRDKKWDVCIFYEDEQFVIIYDRYYKSKYHLLIMPRVKIKSVYDLDPYDSSHIELIEGMIARAKWIKMGLKKKDKSIDNIKYGFHAIPSLNQLHMHCISDDMDSPNMKNKKHFHSFTSQYFIPGKVMLRVLKEKKRKFTVNKGYYDGLLKEKLKCHKCFDVIRTMPALKNHINRCEFGKKKKKNKFQFRNTLSVNDDIEMSDDDKDFEIVFANDVP